MSGVLNRRSSRREADSSDLRAAITLHNPYIDFGDSQCVSTARCISAARAILTQHYALTATSFDITRLHPFATVRVPSIAVAFALMLTTSPLFSDMLVLGCRCAGADLQTLHRDRRYGSGVRGLGGDQCAEVGPTFIGRHQRLIHGGCPLRFAMTEYGKRSPIGSKEPSSLA